MIATLAPDCQSIELNDSYVIDDIGTSNNQDLICGYKLKVDYNCCTPMEYIIPSNPDVTIQITACGSELITDILTPYYDIQVDIDMPECCIETFTWNSEISSGSTTINGPGNSFSFRLYFTVIEPGNILTNSFQFTTTGGSVYLYDYTISNVTSPDHCGGGYSIAITGSTLPTLAATSGVTVDTIGNTITLTDTTFGQNTDHTTTNTLKEGVYCMTIQGENCDGVPLVDGGAYGQRLYSESVTLFVDCADSIRCRIAQIAPTCETSDPLWIYEALIFNNTCQVLSCQDVCNLYKTLVEFLDNNCKTANKPCNCG